jgi:hypothetical protein
MLHEVISFVYKFNYIVDGVSLEVVNISNLWENISEILILYENTPMLYCGIQVIVFDS